MPGRTDSCRGGESCPRFVPDSDPDPAFQVFHPGGLQRGVPGGPGLCGRQEREGACSNFPQEFLLQKKMCQTYPAHWRDHDHMHTVAGVIVILVYVAEDSEFRPFHILSTRQKLYNFLNVWEIVCVIIKVQSIQHAEAAAPGAAEGRRQRALRQEDHLRVARQTGDFPKNSRFINLKF